MTPWRPVKQYGFGVLLGMALATAGGVAGCRNPHFKREQAVRDERMSRYLSGYATHDKAGWERVRKSVEVHRDLSAYRAKHRADTRALVHSSYETRQQLWEDRRPKRRRFVKDQLRGEPEQIDDTFARIAY